MLQEMLSKYEKTILENDPWNDKQTLRKFEQLLSVYPRCLYRDHFPGHLTASAWIVSKDLQRVLLMFHKKLNKWIQVGGHADGDAVLHEVALKEAFEESGLKDLTFFKDQKEPFDLDIHLIPAYGTIQEHYHFDVRYLLIAQSEEIIANEESLDLKWVPFAEVPQFSHENSIFKQLEKSELLLKESALL